MQNAVVITEESINYLILVTAQNWPATSEWLQSVKGRLNELHSFRNGNMYLTRNDMTHKTEFDCPWLTIDANFLKNNSDKYVASPYID